jgi:thiol:disulfide interchange protein DsbA
MTLSRRDFHRFMLASLASAALPAASASLELGRDYDLIEPSQPSESPGKIEVLEFFSYGCPHCKDFQPLVMAWAAKLPKDVSFKRVPVTFGRAAWTNLARLYHGLQGSGDLDRLDAAVFRAIHEQRTDLYTDAAIAEWVKRQGVDVKRFAASFDSFSVNTQVARDEQLVKNYKVKSVPLLTVAGRYAVTGQAAKTLADRLPIADGLIQLARKKRRS